MNAQAVNLDVLDVSRSLYARSILRLITMTILAGYSLSAVKLATEYDDVLPLTIFAKNFAC